MTLAFLIYTYFPYGGQQRDFLRVVNEWLAQGNKITVYTMEWTGERPEGLEIIIVPVRAWRSHKRYQQFTAAVSELLRERPVDGVVGFNKMPGLDVYYAADPCFVERAVNERGFYYRYTARYRHFAAYEKAVFGEGSKTQVLLLSPLQRSQFAKHYPGCLSRLHDVPPGIARDRMHPENAAEIRAQLREEFGFGDQHHVIVQIGSGFVIKGLDRSLRAIASLPEQLRSTVRFLIVGQDKPGRFLRLAKRLDITENCIFLGGRDDVPRFLTGADLLLHPAYSESAGYVLLEATIAGLPVLTTDTCGYAFHIAKAGSGQVCPSPFSQDDLDRRLADMLTSNERSDWSRNGIHYGQTHDLYSMPERAASIIATLVADKAAAGEAA